MSVRLVALAFASSLALAACGSEERAGTPSGQSSTAAGAAEQATPAEARAEIGAVRTALDTALGSLQEGDAKAADNAVAEGYLQHFENVEGPLEKVDHELKERLEESIREKLRDTIRNGGSVAEVTTMVRAIKADLATAERKLR
jgi:hypothetical protein